MTRLVEWPYWLPVLRSARSWAAAFAASTVAVLSTTRRLVVEGTSKLPAN